MSHGDRMEGSVNIRTVKRVSNDMKRYHDKDYEEDWSKLRDREYEQKNHSLCFRLLQINKDTNRCVTGTHVPLGPMSLGTEAHVSLWTQ